jgi:hypothetical protein
MPFANLTIFSRSAPYYQPESESNGEVNLESSIMSYWVMPPPENRPTEYGRPMLMTYSVNQEHYLSQDALNEMVLEHLQRSGLFT